MTNPLHIPADADLEEFGRETVSRLPQITLLFWS